MRSIPPKTMNTVAPGRPRPNASRLVAQLGQNIRDLQERLRTMEAGDGLDLSVTRSVARPRTAEGSSRPMTRPAGSGGYGRIYRRPTGPRRSVDLLIPPRPGPGRAPVSHVISRTAEAYLVRVEFPVPVRPEEILWHVNRDVLEVEYLGQDFTYYHEFLVPADVEPTVEQEGRNLTFRFMRKD